MSSCHNLSDDDDCCIVEEIGSKPSTSAPGVAKKVVPNHRRPKTNWLTRLGDEKRLKADQLAGLGTSTTSSASSKTKKPPTKKNNARKPRQKATLQKKVNMNKDIVDLSSTGLVIDLRPPLSIKSSNSSASARETKPSRDFIEATDEVIDLSGNDCYSSSFSKRSKLLRTPSVIYPLSEAKEISFMDENGVSSPKLVGSFPSTSTPKPDLKNESAVCRIGTDKPRHLVRRLNDDVSSKVRRDRSITPQDHRDFGNNFDEFKDEDRSTIVTETATAVDGEVATLDDSATVPKNVTVFDIAKHAADVETDNCGDSSTSTVVLGVVDDAGDTGGPAGSVDVDDFGASTKCSDDIARNGLFVEIDNGFGYLLHDIAANESSGKGVCCGDSEITFTATPAFRFEPENLTRYVETDGYFVVRDCSSTTAKTQVSSGKSSSLSTVASTGSEDLRMDPDYNENGKSLDSGNHNRPSVRLPRQGSGVIANRTRAAMSGRCVRIHGDSSRERLESTAPSFVPLAPIVADNRSIDLLGCSSDLPDGKRVVGEKKVARRACSEDSVDAVCGMQISKGNFPDDGMCGSKESSAAGVPLCEDIRDDGDSLDLTKTSSSAFKSNHARSTNCSAWESSSSFMIDRNSPSKFENGSSVRSQSQTTRRIPYFLKHFLAIIQEAVNDPWHRQLTTESDEALVQQFLTLSDNAKTLYVRCFMRKFQWLPTTKLKNYCADIVDSCLEEVMAELEQAQLIETASNIADLKTALKLLDANKLRTVAKVFKIDVSAKMGDIRSSLLNHSRKQSTLFGSVESAILKRVKAEMDVCYRLTEAARFRFLELVTVVAPLDMDCRNLADDPNINLVQKLMFKLLQIENGEILFPTYEVMRGGQAHVFSSRTDLSEYIMASDLYCSTLRMIKSKQFEEVDQILPIARDKLEIETRCETQCDQGPPGYSHSSQALYVKVVWSCVEALQKLKRYQEAVEITEDLLAKSGLISKHRRGRWYDRLALNYHIHLKQPDKALFTIRSALSDVHVGKHWKFDLYNRADKIVTSANGKIKNKRKCGSPKKRRKKDDTSTDVLLDNPDITFEMPAEPAAVSIEGELMSKGLVEGVNTVFVSNDAVGGGERAFSRCSVERVAINHFINKEDFTEGLHGEGSPYRAVFGLVFWHIVFDLSIPRAFLFKFQTGPLDFISPEPFYEKRRNSFLDRFVWFRDSPWDDIQLEMRSVWDANVGVLNDVVSWNCFTDFEQCFRFTRSLGKYALNCLFPYMAKDFRNLTAGMPDVVMWNDKYKIKIAEVKGPGDRLSAKQVIWLDFLRNKCKLDAFVCYVQGKTNRKL